MFHGSAIENIRIPSTLTKIEARTFLNCYYLKIVEISHHVEYLGNECFKNSGIEEITLPNTLKEISKNAF